MKRRNFMSLLGGAAAWPFAARAQQPEPMRRIGVLMQIAEGDAESKIQVAEFLRELRELGWVVGRNVKLDTRWAGGDSDRIRKYAAELVALAPDVVLASGGTVVGALQQASRTVPIVFVNVTDPIGRGYVASLAEPGGNATGFTSFEFGIGGKWLELLKQIAPGVARVAVLRDPVITAGMGYLAAIHALAPSFGVEVSPVDVRVKSDMERAIAAFARTPNGGLIITPDPAAIAHREVIIALASQYRLPAIYPFRYFAAEGGLISYGPNAIEQFRRAASYADRILKGEKPGNLPVQAPTKFELAISLKTAKALDVAVPQMLVSRADELIE
ncbi:MAG TPA: ABC transporter substrate-binding protein [Bradyrhizobium sp.]|uniref:ABC transporter substrate-binding protein n=1 Tax=Bradyrhizobium sp. TaxID=376 RepID=UPI002D0980F0|nr:ABC transporter substrate-binding protein [Bradyrhizobium sp.]HXB76466.1 ABC transporter substrate-binding protein [Bradyrhizobium sp.]